MKNILKFLLIGLIITSCSNESEECCTNIDTGISIKYINQEEENLFEFENGLNEADINIYHNINNEWIRYYKVNLDYPKGIRTINREGETYLVIFPSTDIVVENYSETKIEFSQMNSDIIKAEINKNGSNTVVTKVWYNDQLKWEGAQGDRIFEIVK